jgi:hypothetical protein
MRMDITFLLATDIFSSGKSMVSSGGEGASS